MEATAPNHGQRRRAQVNLQDMTSAETIVLVNAAAATRNSKKIIHAKTSSIWMFFLFALWSSWMLIGTCFYKYYGDYTWSKAFYMNVNVGWGLNWVLDETFRGDYLLRQGGMQLFSLLHTVIGFIFILYLCISIAMQLIVKKNQWLDSAHSRKSTSYIALSLQKYLPIAVQEFDFSMWKFIIFFHIWIVIGVLWYSSTHDWRVVESIDYVFST
jgi:hypothetical protein